MRDRKASGFFVLRTPLLPFEELLKLSAGSALTALLKQGIASHSDSDAALEAAATADRVLIRSRLQALVSRPEVTEALWIGSPELSDSLPLWWKEPESEKGRKLERALYRYLARMTARSTPFGLFAACSLGEIAESTSLELGALQDYRRRSRLDMEYLYNLAEKIALDPALRSDLQFRPNTSLYLAADRYHHAQSYLRDKVRYYRLVATVRTSYLDDTLHRAAEGATPRALAAALVAADPEVSLQEADYYIGQLIESQVLAADLAPPITGPEPLEAMLQQIRQAGLTDIAEVLASVAERIEALDRAGAGASLSQYQEIVGTISRLPVEFKPEHIIQVDAMKPSPNARLSQGLVDEILQAIGVLHSIQSAARQTVFKKFKEDFQEKYQDREVPLLEVLDDEVGIGFEKRDEMGALVEPLIDDIDLALAGDDDEFTYKRSETALLRKVEELWNRGDHVLHLDQKLLEALRIENPLPLPDAFSVMGSVLALAETGSENSTEGKQRFYLGGVQGPSGANLLGRFCHLDDRLTNFVREHVREEEELKAGDNLVFAEIAHLPEGRVGNVLFRPVLRRYEIPYLATSTVPADRQIPVSDLMVSVRNDRVVLRSRKLNCEVAPRLSTAHGFANSRNLKLYKFLCTLQTQGVTALSWNWGMLDRAGFLPRVVMGNVVFSLARWLVTKDMIETFANGSVADRLRNIEAWRKTNRVPRFVYLAESDNQLLIDFENILSIETVFEYVKKRPKIRLVEMFPGPDDLPVRGPEGTFVHEVLIPFVSKPKAAAVAANLPAEAKHAGLAASSVESPAVFVPRSFLPGGEWLFAKVYANPAMADRFLIEGIKPLVEKMERSGEIDRWFFIRYADPQWHLRLRFHGNPAALNSVVLPQIWECVEREHRLNKVRRFQLDTYDREIERYGGPEGIEIAERLFHYDSELSLELLGLIADRLGSHDRWRLAFLGVDRLLTGLGFDLAEKRDLANRMGESWEKRFAMKERAQRDRYKKQLSDKFRSQRQILIALLQPQDGQQGKNGKEDKEDKEEKKRKEESESRNGGATIPIPAYAAYNRFSDRLNLIRTDLEGASQSGKLVGTLPDLAASYVHMHLNRMFRSAANAQETVLYDFLARTYDSLLAMRKKSAATT